MSKEFDVVVIGAGPGGYIAAIRAAQLGKIGRVYRKMEEPGRHAEARRHVPERGLHSVEGAAGVVGRI